jgi:hypothetical protein
MPLYTSPGLLAAPAGGMMVAPTIVGSSTSFFSSSGLTSYTVSHTVPAGANCLALYVGPCKGSGEYNITAASWNGTGFATLKDAIGWTFTRGGSAARVCAIADPGAGTHDIVIALDVAPDSLALYAVNLAGVDTSGGGAAMALATGGAGSLFFNLAALSDTLDAAAPTLIFGGMSLAQPPGAASFTPGTGVVELAEGVASGAAASAHCFGYRRETIAGDYAFGATCTQSSACTLAAVAFRGS